MAVPGANIPIEIRTDERELESHRMDSLNILIYLLLMVLTVVTVWIFKHRRFPYVHETGLAILYGLIVGAIIKYASPAAEMSHMVVQPVPTPTVPTPPPSGPNSSLLPPPFPVPPEVPLPPETVWLELEVKKSNPLRAENRTFAYQLRGEVLHVTASRDALLQQKATFDPEIFFNIVLPPIIFSAGYSMKRRHFFQNFGAIFVFAIAGTSISIFVVASITFAFTRLMPSLAFTFNDCLFFGSIISSTDPVTILAIFHDLRVDVTLHAIVFGESALNDAVAIVFANSVQNYATKYQEGDEFQLAALFKAFGNFFGVFFGSFATGAALGCATALLTKFTRLADFPLLETALFVLMSYSSFLIAEAADLTGIVAVLFCGICQAHYTYNNLSPLSQDHSKFFFELLSFLAENFIFAYIGVSMFTFPYHRFAVTFILVAFLAVILGRVCNIYPLSALLNLGRKRKIPLNFQHMIFFSGLRGAISFALAIRNTVTPARQAMLTATSLIVMVTVTAAGATAPRLVNFLRIPAGVSQEADRRLSASSPKDGATDAEAAAYGSLPGRATSHREKTLAARVWRSFDDRYVKPLLTHSRPTLMDTCPDCCLPLTRWLTSSRQFGQDRWRQTVDEEEMLEEEDGPLPGGGSDNRGLETAEASPRGSAASLQPRVTIATTFDTRDLPV